jgi:WD40 repeat protein
MGKPPIILNYWISTRRRWRLHIALLLVLLVSTAGWYFQRPIRLWVSDTYADWVFARSFDSVERELIPENTYWLASAGSNARNDRADQLLAQLLAFGPPDISECRDAESNKVLFAHSGSTSGKSWLAFACISRNGLNVYSFERAHRSAACSDTLAQTRTFWFGDAFDVRIRSVRLQGDSVSTAIDINNGPNEIIWTVVPAPSGRMQSNIAYSSARVSYAARPVTGWVSTGSFWADWWPNTGDYTLMEGAASDAQLPGIKDVGGVSFIGADQIAAASTTSVVLINVPQRKGIATHSFPAAQPRDAAFREVFVFSQNGERLFVGGTSVPALLVDVVDDKSRPFGQTAGRARAKFIDDRTLAVADNVSFERVDWATAKATPIEHGADNSRLLTFGASLNLWAIPKDDTHVRLYDGNTGTAIADFEEQFSFYFGDVSISPCGRWLAVVGQEGLRLHDIRSRQILWRCDWSVDRWSSPVKWTADGRFGAVAGYWYVYVWSTESPHWVARFPADNNSLSPDVALSPDGRSMAASASESETISYWPDIGKARSQSPAK